MLSKYKGNLKPVAESTDFLVSIKRREISPKYIINIKGFSGLNFISGAIVEVEVDQEAGKIKVKEIVLSDDYGFDINPLHIQEPIES